MVLLSVSGSTEFPLEENPSRGLPFSLFSRILAALNACQNQEKNSLTIMPELLDKIKLLLRKRNSSLAKEFQNY